MPSWSLRDPSENAKTAKYTFYLPSPERVSHVKPGDNVKLIFGFETDKPDYPAAERMWVLVSEVDGLGGFKGHLNNQPAYIEDLKYEDPVEFSSNHIIAIDGEISTHYIDAAQIDLIDKFTKRCFVTSRILSDKQVPKILYREEPDREDDSGWRILAGDEDDTYMDDSNNVHYVSLGAVLNINDLFVNYLAAPVGSYFILEDNLSEYTLVEDPAP